MVGVVWFQRPCHSITITDEFFNLTLCLFMLKIRLRIVTYCLVRNMFVCVFLVFFFLALTKSIQWKIICVEVRTVSLIPHVSIFTLVCFQLHQHREHMKKCQHLRAAQIFVLVMLYSSLDLSIVPNSSLNDLRRQILLKN